ncbi:MAG: hypothetical protein WEB53_09035 [Akkermansiaceae bacterium]
MAMATYVLVSVFACAYVIFFIVITIGGFFDLLHLIRGIKTEIVDPEDDGRAMKASDDAANPKS